MRVDFDRLRKERLAKLQAEMKVDNLGALILFAGANIRYATASYQGNWKYNINIRYAVVPAEGPPTLFETAGSDLQCAKIDLPWMEPGRIRPAVTWQWAEGRRAVHGRPHGRLGHGSPQGAQGREGEDRHRQPRHAGLRALTKLGLNIVNGWPSVSRARVVKTPDEIELLKMASSIGDAAMWKIKYEWLKPGVREREIEAKVHEFMLERGCEIIYDIIVASAATPARIAAGRPTKLIRQGDLVIVDINAVGPSGYFIDFVRLFKCGGAQGMKMTPKEIDLYKEVYDSMYAGIEQLKPGNTTADVVKQFPHYDDDEYTTVTLQQFAHSIGITLYEGCGCRVPTR
jgi:Xaa-Pro aminopeptidase